MDAITKARIAVLLAIALVIGLSPRIALAAAPANVDGASGQGSFIYLTTYSKTINASQELFADKVDQSAGYWVNFTNLALGTSTGGTPQSWVGLGDNTCNLMISGVTTTQVQVTIATGTALNIRCYTFLHYKQATSSISQVAVKYNTGTTTIASTSFVPLSAITTCSDPCVTSNSTVVEVATVFRQAGGVDVVSYTYGSGGGGSGGGSGGGGGSTPLPVSSPPPVTNPCLSLNSSACSSPPALSQANVPTAVANLSGIGVLIIVGILGFATIQGERGRRKTRKRGGWKEGKRRDPNKEWR